MTLLLCDGIGGGGIGTGKSGIVPTDEVVEGLDDWVMGEVIIGDESSSSSRRIPLP